MMHPEQICKRLDKLEEGAGGTDEKIECYVDDRMGSVLKDLSALTLSRLNLADDKLNARLKLIDEVEEKVTAVVGEVRDMRVYVSDLNDGVAERDANYSKLSADLRGIRDDLISRFERVVSMQDEQIEGHQRETRAFEFVHAKEIAALQYRLDSTWTQYLLSFFRKPTRIFK